MPHFGLESPADGGTAVPPIGRKAWQSALVKSVVAQQIYARTAQTVCGRLYDLLDEVPLHTWLR